LSHLLSQRGKCWGNQDLACLLGVASMLLHTQCMLKICAANMAGGGVLVQAPVAVNSDMRTDSTTHSTAPFCPPLQALTTVSSYAAAPGACICCRAAPPGV
jgi:hypothetical protein